MIAAADQREILAQVSAALGQTQRGFGGPQRGHLIRQVVGLVGAVRQAVLGHAQLNFTGVAQRIGLRVFEQRLELLKVL